MRGLGWRDPVNENAGMAAIVVLNIPELRNDVGRERRSHSLGAGAIFLQIGPLAQLTVRAPDNMGGGQFAEQFETNLVVDANEKRTNRQVVANPPGNSILET